MSNDKTTVFQSEWFSVDEEYFVSGGERGVPPRRGAALSIVGV